MLNKFKGIADWWSGKTSDKKLSIMYLSFIFGLCYVNYENGGTYKSNIGDCRSTNKELYNKLDKLVGRFNDYRVRADKQIQEIYKDFNEQQIKDNEKWLKEYKVLFEKYDDLYHKTRTRQ